MKNKTKLIWRSVFVPKLELDEDTFGLKFVSLFKTFQLTASQVFLYNTLSINLYKKKLKDKSFRSNKAGGGGGWGVEAIRCDTDINDITHES